MSNDFDGIIGFCEALSKRAAEVAQIKYERQKLKRKEYYKKNKDKIKAKKLKKKLDEEETILQEKRWENRDGWEKWEEGCLCWQSTGCFKCRNTCPNCEKYSSEEDKVCEECGEVK